MSVQRGFFDLDERYGALSAIVHFEVFRGELELCVPGGPGVVEIPFPSY